MTDLWIPASPLTRREQYVQDSNYAANIIAQTIASNDLMLIEVIAGGEHQFRNRFTRNMRGYLCTDDVVKRVWTWLCAQHHARFFGDPANTVADGVKPPPEQISDAELFKKSKNWVREIDSSEDAMRKQGQGSRRHREGTLEEVFDIPGDIREQHEKMRQDKKKPDEPESPLDVVLS